MNSKLSCAPDTEKRNLPTNHFFTAAGLVSLLMIVTIPFAWAGNLQPHASDRTHAVEQVFAAALAGRPETHGRRAAAGGADRDVIDWVRRQQEQDAGMCRSGPGYPHGTLDEVSGDMADSSGLVRHHGIPPLRKDSIVLPESLRRSPLLWSVCRPRELPD